MRFLVSFALLALAACVPAARAPAPTPPPAPVRTIAPPPPTAAHWRDGPVTPGAWTYLRAEFGRSVATFGRGDATFSARLTCDARGRTVTLSIVAAAGAPPVTIRTSTLVRTLPTIAMAHVDAWPPMTWDARIAATDLLLDAIAFSRGRFTIETPGRAALVIPAWPAIGRVIEDCRG